jgi:hypothetical protein
MSSGRGAFGASVIVTLLVCWPHKSLRSIGLLGCLSPRKDFPIYSGMDRTVIDTYHLGSTPQTIVVSRSGAVVTAWNGAYLGVTRAAIEHFFKASLPVNNGLD